MKDMFGKDIEVGDYAIYIQSFASKHLEKAIVIQSEEKFIKIEYLGETTQPLVQYCKLQGAKSKLTATEKRIVIINSEPSDEKNVYIDSKKRFDSALKKVKKELLAAIKSETDLLKENKELRAEANRIHDRFDILDL